MRVSKHHTDRLANFFDTNHPFGAMGYQVQVFNVVQSVRPGDETMSTYYYLVCLKTMQSVEIAGVGGFGVRASQNPKAQALFCHAHTGEFVQMMSEHDLEASRLDHGELMEWSDENAEMRFTALTGRVPLNYGDD